MAVSAYRGNPWERKALLDEQVAADSRIHVVNRDAALFCKVTAYLLVSCIAGRIRGSVAVKREPYPVRVEYGCVSTIGCKEVLYNVGAAKVARRYHVLRKPDDVAGGGWAAQFRRYQLLDYCLSHGLNDSTTGLLL